MKTMNKLVEGAQTVLANFRVVLPDTQDVLPEEIVLQKNTEENRLRFLDILERYECRQAKEEAYFLFGEPIANLDNQPQNR